MGVLGDFCNFIETSHVLMLLIGCGQEDHAVEFAADVGEYLLVIVFVSFLISYKITQTESIEIER